MMLSLSAASLASQAPDAMAHGRELDAGLFRPRCHDTPAEHFMSCSNSHCSHSHSSLCSHHTSKLSESQSMWEPLATTEIAHVFEFEQAATRQPSSEIYRNESRSDALANSF